MENRLSFSVPIPKEKVFQVLKNLDLLFRLNIQWHLKSHNFSTAPEQNREYQVVLRWEKDDKESTYTVKILDYQEGEVLDFAILENTNIIKRIIFLVTSQNNLTTIDVKEIADYGQSRESLLELNLWVKSILNYAMLLQSDSIFAKIWKSFLDKVYLKLSPTGRRLVFLIVISEIFALLFFILIVLYFIFAN